MSKEARVAELSLERIDSPSGVVHVVVAGTLDAHTAPQLDRVVEDALRGGTRRLVCDIERLTYIASAGVGVLIAALNTLQERGGRLALVCPQEVAAREDETGLAEGFNPMEVFRLLGLSEAFTVASTRAEAERRV